MEQLETYAIAKRIIEQELNGLPVNEAKWVLREAANLLDSTHVVDTSSPGFLAFVEELRSASAGSN